MARLPGRKVQNSQQGQNVDISALEKTRKMSEDPCAARLLGPTIHERWIARKRQNILIYINIMGENMCKGEGGVFRQEPLVYADAVSE